MAEGLAAAGSIDRPKLISESVLRALCVLLCQLPGSISSAEGETHQILQEGAEFAEV